MSESFVSNVMADQRAATARIARITDARVEDEAPAPGSLRARLMRTSTNYRPNLL